MKGINKVIIVGTLGQDPEVRYLQSGAAVANLSVATTDSWKDKNTGEKQERTEWHRVALFGKLAEIAGEYLRKGSKAYFEGSLQTRKWQAQDGTDRYSTEVKVRDMQMLGGNPGGQTQQPAAQQPQPQRSQPRAGDFDDDPLPF